MKYLLSIFLTITLFAHPFHFTIAEMEHNPKNGSLEVSLCVFNENLHTIKDKMLPQYIAKNFIVQRKSRKVSIKWVGKEPMAGATWLYFEFPKWGKLEGTQLHNTLFFAKQDKQINIVNFGDGKQKGSLTFTKQVSLQTISFQKKKANGKSAKSAKNALHKK